MHTGGKGRGGQDPSKEIKAEHTNWQKLLDHIKTVASILVIIGVIIGVGMWIQSVNSAVSDVVGFPEWKSTIIMRLDGIDGKLDEIREYIELQNGTQAKSPPQEVKEKPEMGFSWPVLQKRSGPSQIDSSPRTSN